MKIVFFDLATLTGWAAGDFRSQPTFGRFEMPRTGEEVGEFLCAAENNIRTVLDQVGPDVIGFEAPFLNPRRDTILKIRKLGGLANEVEKAAYRRSRTPCREATLGEIRSHFLGKGYPRDSDRAKIAVKNQCRRLGWKVRDDNEADALAGLDFLRSIFRPDKAVASTPLFQSNASRQRARAIPLE